MPEIHGPFLKTTFILIILIAGIVCGLFAIALSVGLSILLSPMWAVGVMCVYFIVQCLMVFIVFKAVKEID